jgi:hypothetical protein
MATTRRMVRGAIPATDRAGVKEGRQGNRRDEAQRSGECTGHQVLLLSTYLEGSRSMVAVEVTDISLTGERALISRSE